MNQTMSERKSKYSDWGDKLGYYDKARVFHNSYMTENLVATLPTIDTTINNKSYEDLLIQSVNINSWQRERNKSQVVRKDVNFAEFCTPKHLKSKPMSATTTYTNHFINHHRWKRILIDSIANEKQWIMAFNRHSKGSMNNKNIIPSNSIDLIVYDCLGMEVPGFILDKIRTLTSDKTNERMITWEDFRSVLEEVAQLYSSELAVKSEMPTLIKLMNNDDIIDKDIGALGELTTVYRDTLVQPASLAMSKTLPGRSRTLPKTAADFILSSVSMDPTSTLLCSGTSKGTFHLPGYAGHIPMNKRNDRKAEHSFALNPRPACNNLLLSQDRIGCLSGYTGHVSSHVHVNDDRTTACDPRTSNGAAYGPIRRML